MVAYNLHLCILFPNVGLPPGEMSLLSLDTIMTISRDGTRDKSREMSQAEDVYIMCDSSHHATLYQQLSEHAAKWREVGTHLGFHQGELDTIASKPSHYHGGPKSCLSAMLSEWLERAPGDGRGSVQCATLNQLKEAVRKSGLGVTAQNLELLQ